MKTITKYIEEILSRVPNYTEFLTIDELNESTYSVADKYSDLAEVFEFGYSRNGEKIIGLKIGNGKNNALVFGLPHPNEPIGTMTMEVLINELVTNDELRDYLDYTWYIVKAWDTDGTRLNENWFKGPYTIYNYARNFFRPAGHQQVDWTFPIKYKNLDFKNTICETKYMMNLIDKIKPKFIYSLHNAGFGGVYWYLTRDIPEVYNNLRESAMKQGVPLNLGEPEAPYCKSYSEAIYELLSIKDEYDYLEKYGVKDVASQIRVGTNSADYSYNNYNSFTLLTELPYFYDKRIDDLSEVNKSRGEVIRESLETSRKYDKFIVDSLEKTKYLMKENNPFKVALEAFTGNDEIYDATEKMTYDDKIFEKNATVAEEFDNKLIRLFYMTLSLGLLVRANEVEISSEKTDFENSLLKEEMEKVDNKLKEVSEYLEKEMDYSVVPIKKLVSIQIECGLIVADYLNKL